jgi:uncharacterized protein (UPF0333 family)
MNKEVKYMKGALSGLTASNISPIKSIQRGTGYVRGYNSTKITIDTVNVNKSVIILNGGGYDVPDGTSNGNYGYHCPVQLLSFASNAFVVIIPSNVDDYAHFSWQVIEFK